LNVTEEVLRNPVPLMVSVAVVDPAGSDAGDRLVIAGGGLGTGATTENVIGWEFPPPGAGLVTITGKLPAVARSVALREIVICAPLTNETACEIPLYVADEDETKPVPLMVRVSGADPAGAEEGASEVSVGWGFGAGAD
jgi:hypothetical protein